MVKADQLDIGHFFEGGEDTPLPRDFSRRGERPPPRKFTRGGRSMPNWLVLTTLILNDFLTKEWALCDFLTKGLFSVRLFDQGVRLCATF